jgi:hypothetical protein
LSAGLLDLRGLANANQSVVWLKLLQCLWGVVDECETSCLSTTELSSQTENIDLVLAGLVEFGKLGSELVLGDVGTVGVEDITATSLECHSKLAIPSIFSSSSCSSPRTRWANLHDHLLAAEERVANELASSQGDWLLAVRHVCYRENGCIRESAFDVETELRMLNGRYKGRCRL